METFSGHLLSLMALLAVGAAAFIKFDTFDEELWKDQNAVLKLVERMKEDEIRPLAAKAAEKCDSSQCKAPGCRCAGWDIPGGLARADVPQMVVLTFQNAVSPQNFIPYQRIFSRRNPNNCPATGTFFVSHTYTDYYQVQALWAQGNEIGDNTVTSGPTDTWDQARWSNEIGEQKENLKKYAHIPDGDIKGFRSPNLKPGGDVMMEALSRLNFSYDATRTTVQFRKQPNMMWPYSYDYLSTQDCPVPDCPTESHPGMWEQLIPAVDGPSGAAWATLGSLRFKNESQVVEYLLKKFEDAYNGNRAPLTFVVDTSFVITSFKIDGFLKFLDSIQRLYNNVYVVSANQSLEWIKNPTPVARLADFGPWKCDRPRSVCTEKAALTCWYDNKRRLVKPPEGGVYKMRWCSDTCTPCYPALGDPNGERC